MWSTVDPYFGLSEARRPGFDWPWNAGSALMIPFRTDCLRKEGTVLREYDLRAKGRSQMVPSAVEVFGMSVSGTE